MSDSRYVVKICLLGENSVGKTSLVYRFIENQFRENYKSTLGVNLLKHDTMVEGYGKVSAQIWDLGGQESFKSLRKLYLEGANGALVIFDVTQEKTFEKLPEWVESFKEARGDQPLTLIGNKIDLKGSIKIDEKEAKSFAKRYKMEILLTSAKTGDNVEDAFNDLINKTVTKVSKEVD